MRRFVSTCLDVVARGPHYPVCTEAEQAKGKSQETQVTVVFSSNQREAARSYFVEGHGQRRLPPGLAKKNNGCLPPGQAKKRYVVGRPLRTELFSRSFRRSYL